MRRNKQSILSLLLALCILALIPTAAYCKQIQDCHRMEMDCCASAVKSQSQIQETPCCDENSAQGSNPTLLFYSNHSHETKDVVYWTCQSSDAFSPSLHLPQNASKFLTRSNMGPPATFLSFLNSPLLC